MKFFKKRIKKAFHEKYPDILEWVINDIICFRKDGYSSVYGYYLGTHQPYHIILRPVNPHEDSREYVVVPFGGCHNKTLWKRRVEMEIKSEYNQFIKDVQSSVKELQGQRGKK